MGELRSRCTRSATSSRVAALNFTRATEQCHVTQPALTRAIQKLEEELGGLLSRRKRHLTRLTDLGLLIRPHLGAGAQRSRAAQDRGVELLRLERARLGSA